MTFDACPTGRPDEYDESVVDVLIKENVPATIFMSGRWVEKNAEKARVLADNGQFEIAAHSFHHPHMTEKPDDRDIREFRATQAVIRKVTGKTPKYFRPPFGEVDERVAKLAADAGLVTIQYDIASGDPDPALSADRIVRTVLRSAKEGSIVVFHINRNGLRTAEALPQIVDGLRKKGFSLVTVGDLLSEEPGQTQVRTALLRAKEESLRGPLLRQTSLKLIEPDDMALFFVDDLVDRRFFLHDPPEFPEVEQGLLLKAKGKGHRILHGLYIVHCR